MDRYRRSPGRCAVPLLDFARYSLWVMSQFRPSRASPQRVEALRDARLRRLLRHAAEQSRLYREKFRGIDLTRCRLADMPVMTKAELMADFDRVVTDTAVRRADLEAFIDDPANVGRL